MTLADDITMLRRLAASGCCVTLSHGHPAINRAIAILSPLASMPPEQLGAMLEQVTSMRAVWLHERCALIAGGYQALAEALRAVKR